MTLADFIASVILALAIIAFGFPIIYWSTKQWPIIWRELHDMRKRERKEQR